ncbi:class I SAM-dependent methyltransferase [Massilia aurea]|uniref:class I SAM-dependent methyltransferase n=1 Tax=Massilia aurea TaxID=373040 RepID=UPI00161A3C12|nr:class I SAM-dependent methyltransferase [Massilia aurea]
MNDVITTQWGSQARPFRAYSDDELMSLLNHVSELMNEIKIETGISVFLSYGCLLGAVRSGKVIPHDFDIDAGFIIPDGTVESILQTADSLISFLIKRDFRITAQSNGHFKAAYYGSEYSVDIEFFAAWTDGPSFYHYFAVRGSEISDQILPLDTISLSGVDFPAPKNPETLVAAIYGENWRNPDPDFKYSLTAEDWVNFKFLFIDSNKGFWDRYYSNQFDNKVWLESPSQFAAFVGSNNSRDTRLLDIGCGNGRDSIFFATLGFDVTCVDYSQAALDVCKATADRRNLSITTEALSVTSFADVFKFSAENSEKFGIVYARFFLHAIDENSERNLLRLAFSVIEPGGKFVLEYRCLATDGSNAHEVNYENGQHYRRLIQQEIFKQAAIVAGFEVEYSTLGRGHAKFRNEDPLIGRMVLTKQLTAG